MHKSILFSLAVLPALALGACGKSSSDSTAASGAVAGDANKAAAAMAFQFQPGKYRSTISLEKFDVPGMPPQVAARMKDTMGKAISSEYCVTPQDAAKGLDVMKEHMGKGKCQFEKFEASGGKMDSVFTCQTNGGGTLRSVSHGTYTATGSEASAVADMTGPGGKTMHIEETVKMERIGDCG